MVGDSSIQKAQAELQQNAIHDVRWQIMGSNCKTNRFVARTYVVAYAILLAITNDYRQRL